MLHFCVPKRVGDCLPTENWRKPLPHIPVSRDPIDGSFPLIVPTELVKLIEFPDDQV
jgi:hypothetical protein